MLGGLLGSRALGSVGVILFGINALRGVHPREWLKQRWWLAGLAWVLIFALSGLWSANKNEWSVLTQVKLPFLLLPLSFGLLPPFSKKQVHAFTVILFVIMLCGCAWSIVHLLRNTEYYLSGYGVSHLIPTPAYNDHISFSTMIAFCVAWGIFQWHAWNGKWRWAGFLAIAAFVIYLHVLAAKTGLAALYIFAFSYLILLMINGAWKKVLVAITIAALAVSVSFMAIPTFRTRCYYIAYAASQYREGNRSGEYGDIGRLLSYRIGGKIIAENPVIGVGAGDMLDEMKNGYSKWYPQVKEENRLLPHNEFLTLSLGGGIICALLFILWIMMPLTGMKKNNTDPFFTLIWLLLLVPLLVDPFLEVQWGVLVYLLPFLWMKKIAGQKNVC